MSTIRPPIFPTSQQPAQSSSSARSAGQRAFFEAAMGRPAVAQTPAQENRAEAPVQKVPVNLPAEPPQKILRPGSLLDIRV